MSSYAPEPYLGGKYWEGGGGGGGGIRNALPKATVRGEEDVPTEHEASEWEARKRPFEA